MSIAGSEVDECCLQQHTNCTQSYIQWVLLVVAKPPTLQNCVQYFLIHSSVYFDPISVSMENQHQVTQNNNYFVHQSSTGVYKQGMGGLGGRGDTYITKSSKTQ